MCSDRIRCDRGTDRAVDSATQSEDNRRESVFQRVVANSENQRVPRGFDVGEVQCHRGRNGVARFGQRNAVSGETGTGDVDEFQCGREQGCPQKHRSLGIEHGAVSVEHQVVLTPDRVDIHDRRAKFECAGVQKREPSFVFRRVKRGRIDNHDNIEVVFREFRNGSVVSPEILTNQEPGRNPAEIHDERARTGDENAFFVEHRIGRQVAFRIGCDDLPVGQDRERIVGTGSAEFFLRGALHKPHHHDGVSETVGGNPCRKSGHSNLGLANEIGT